MPKNGLPDGDSVRFKPDNLDLLENLEGVKPRVSSTTGSVQLRFEGIDAIEKGAIKPLSLEAKDNMLKLIGYDASNAPTPRGYILTRMTDPHGRLIAYVYPGSISRGDGTNVFLNPEMLKSSVNYKQMQDGYAYPLYYNTLFADLRNEFNAALEEAKIKERGYWKTDKTLSGVVVDDKASLALIDPVWPKLWRRFEEYLAGHNSMAQFVDWLNLKNERVVKIDTTDETGLANIINVNGNKVKMTEKPENLMIVTVINRE